jgi:hypothetical protein
VHLVDDLLRSGDDLLGTGATIGDVVRAFEEVVSRVFVPGMTILTAAPVLGWFADSSHK